MTGRENLRESPARDEGVAMILVLAWSMALMALALIVTQAAIRQIQPSDRPEQSSSALAARARANPARASSGFWRGEVAVTAMA